MLAKTFPPLPFMKSRPSSVRHIPALKILAAVTLLGGGTEVLDAREWRFVGIPDPLEADFVASGKGGVVLKGPNGKSFEVPLANFGPSDQTYLKLLAAGDQPSAVEAPGPPIITRTGYDVTTRDTVADQVLDLKRGTEFHIGGDGDPLAGSIVRFTSPESWLIFDKILPSMVISQFLDRMLVAGKPAEIGANVRVVRYGQGAVVIPQPPDFPAMTLIAKAGPGAKSEDLQCFTAYGEAKLGAWKGSLGSLVLRRGYMATLAEKPDGTGASVNLVAQDHDLVLESLPKGLDSGIGFIRIFPWRWTGKKGFAGDTWQKLGVAWNYNWSINASSSPDHEYVPIRQNRKWPGLNQDWKARGATHLLGFNEPDQKGQANMTADEAIAAWPALLDTGLRLGAPAVSDGGLGWLYDFMKKADATGLRVDFVPVHYYRSVGNPDDAKGAAAQFHRFLEQIHERVKRPLWVTEWNNGANWTKDPVPTAKQQKAAVAAMTEMLDETPFVERYAFYNWVGDTRALVAKDGSLTPAGEAYRDESPPVAYEQAKGGR